MPSRSLRPAVGAQAILSFDAAIQEPRDLAGVPVGINDRTGSHYTTLQSLEGVLVNASAQLRETLPRYETRLALDDIETDIDGDGQALILVRGRIAGARVTLAIDPLRRRVCAVHLR